MLLLQDINLQMKRLNGRHIAAKLVETLGDLAQVAACVKADLTQT